MILLKTVNILFVCLESLYIKIVTIVMFQRDLQRERQGVQDLQHRGKNFYLYF